MEDCPFKDFPLEITRIILEDASRGCPQIAHALVLSCHTTRKWYNLRTNTALQQYSSSSRIEPILYFDVSIPDLGSMWTLKRSIEARNDPAFFARSVRALTICVGDASATDSAMDVCTRLTTLRILLPGRRDKTLHAQRIFHIPNLRHLTTLTSLIFVDGLTISADRLPPHITHVHILRATRGTCNGTPSRQIKAMLSERPSITHLMCGLAPPFSVVENELPDFILNTLQDNICPHLRVFTILGTSEYFPGFGSLSMEYAEERLWRLSELSERVRMTEPRAIVVNTDLAYFGITKDVLDIDSFEEDQIWEKAEEYLNKRRALKR